MGITSCTLLLLLVGVQQILASSESQSRWNYDASSPHGPSNWRKLYPKCGGNAQSPIDIHSKSAKYDRDLGSVHFENYDKTNAGTFHLKNTGPSIGVEIKPSRLSISGSKLPGKNYELSQFHFHWGRRDNEGSEHLIDGKASALEIHFVHWNVDKYNNFEEASTTSDGLAVVGVLVEVTDQDSNVNKELAILTKLFSRIPNAGDNITIPSFSLKDILPASQNFYRYRGSLTTPGCYESVTWTVMMEPIYITSKQMKKFRAVRNSEGKVGLFNYRPPQPINARTIYTNKLQTKN